MQEWTPLQQATVLQATPRCVSKTFGKGGDNLAHVDELGQCIVRVADLDAARSELLSDETLSMIIRPHTWQTIGSLVFLELKWLP